MAAVSSPTSCAFVDRLDARPYHFSNHAADFESVVQVVLLIFAIRQRRNLVCTMPLFGIVASHIALHSSQGSIAWLQFAREEPNENVLMQRSPLLSFGPIPAVSYLSEWRPLSPAKEFGLNGRHSPLVGGYGIETILFSWSSCRSLVNE